MFDIEHFKIKKKCRLIGMTERKEVKKYEFCKEV